ncbi:MAG: HAMP domain-containing protein [Cytophagales bacterium]|nr:MAG: HAMP domain-containing protein [Cytophagales bacterium]
MSLYTKFILLCIFVVLFTSLTLFYFANQEAQNTLKAQIITDLTQRATTKMDNIERFMYQRLSDIKTASLNPILRSIELYNTKQLNELLLEIQKTNPLYYSISYFTIDRVRIADSKGLSVGEKHSNSRYWQKINQAPNYEQTVMDISLSESVGQIVMHFASTVKDYNGKVIGVLVTRVLIQHLYEVFVNEEERKILGKEKLHLDLIASDNTILYSSYNEKAALKQHYAETPVWELLKERDVNNYETNNTLYFYVKDKGYLDFKGNHWALVLNMPTKSVYLPLQEIRNKMFYVLAFILSISIVITLVVARRITQPILLLAKAAERIANGHLDTEFRVKTHDEIKKLSVQLHKMAKNLKRKIKEQSEMNEELELKFLKINEQKEEISAQKDKIEEQNLKIKLAYSEIESKNKDITASINYASRIQQSMLPEEHLLQSYFPESFILFEPKDIVSGDFYWYDQIQRNGKKYFVIASADCTGHGVPGAIMAMLGSNLLSQIIYYGDSLDTSEILFKLNREIQKELNQELNEQNSQDGMEISLCVIDLENYKMQCSSAGRPIYIVRQEELIEFQGDKITIGGVDFNRLKQKLPVVISNATLELFPDDVIYLSSDGYKDQFGEQTGRKMGSKKFKELLRQLSNNESTQQKQLLEQHLKQWKGKEDQVDDILLISIRIQ